MNKTRTINKIFKYMLYHTSIMCHAVRCEICGLLMEYDEYYTHIKECKPETEKASITVEGKSRRVRKI